MGLSAYSPDPERPLTNTYKDCDSYTHLLHWARSMSMKIWGQTALMEAGSRLELSSPASSRRV